MLVLTRKKGEAIVIGDGIEIVVLSTEGDTVRLGIQAPKQVQIFRKEVLASILQSNQEASQHVIKPEDLRNMLKIQDI